MKFRDYINEGKIPEEFKEYNGVYNMGLTEVKFNHKKSIIVISHTSNMGNRLKDVIKNVDELFGKETWKKLDKKAKHIEEKGSPDYLYTKILKF